MKFPCIFLLTRYFLVAGAILCWAPQPAKSQEYTPNSTIPSLQTPIDQYLLGSGDVLSITFFNVPEYSGEQRILANGVVNLPVVGPITLAGMTLSEAETVLEMAYRSELRHPAVALGLLQPRPLQIAITGEIHTPGLYNLEVTEAGQFPSLVQAIQVAGGVTQSANLNQVRIQRVVSEGQTQSFTVNLLDLLQAGNLSQDIALRDGDSIVLTAAPEIDLATTAQIAASNLATDAAVPINIAVVGEVFRPGTYNYAAGEEVNADTSGASSNTPSSNTQQQSGKLTLTRALRLAGGLKPLADLRNIQVQRTTHQGTPQTITLNLWTLLEAGDLQQDLVLQSGDTITVATATAATSAEIGQLTTSNLSPDRVQVNIVGEVGTPGTVKVSADTTLNQVILAAGGFSPRARQQAELIRLNPNGTVTQRSIQIDLTQGLNPETNPIIMNNDIVVINPSGAASLADGLSTLLRPFLEILPINFNGWNGLNF